jgi:hypothetical protein
MTELQKGESEFVWALKNISFEVKEESAWDYWTQWRGEVYLLKLLSRLQRLPPEI